MSAGMAQFGMQCIECSIIHLEVNFVLKQGTMVTWRTGEGRGGQGRAGDSGNMGDRKSMDMSFDRHRWRADDRHHPRVRSMGSIACNLRSP